MDVQASQIAALPAGDSPQPPESAPRRPSSHWTDYHRICLVLSIGVLVVACLLQVRTDQRVAFSLLPGLPLPEVCQSKVLLGLECPGCGLTRSFVHLAHGDPAASLAVHPLGWLVALFVAVQIPYRVWAIRSPAGAPLGELTPWVITAALALLLLTSWLARLLA